MRILVTNDDGIDATGLQILEQIARTISNDVWIVAPVEEQSGAGHSLTINEPLRINQLDEKKFTVSGTPTDCVLLAKNKIISEPIDLVLSGINRGANYAEDITYSGTVAAAMEGAILEIPSIALSLDGKSDENMLWDTPLKQAPDIIKKLLTIGWDKNNLININFPNIKNVNVKGVKFARQGKRDMIKNGGMIIERKDPKNRPYYWIGMQSEKPDKKIPTSDMISVKEGYISITPITMDLTNYTILDMLEKNFK